MKDPVRIANNFIDNKHKFIVDREVHNLYDGGVDERRVRWKWKTSTTI